MNAQMWIRGHRADDDGWADRGCTGWGHDDVLPYVRRAESYGTFANDPDHAPAVMIGERAAVLVRGVRTRGRR